MGTEIQINNIVSEILVSRVVRQCSNNVTTRCCIGSYRLCCEISDTCFKNLGLRIGSLYPYLMEAVIHAKTVCLISLLVTIVTHQGCRLEYSCYSALGP
jgi:hypothetical protein